MRCTDHECVHMYICIVDRHEDCGGRAAGTPVGGLLRHAPRDVRIRGEYGS